MATVQSPQETPTPLSAFKADLNKMNSEIQTLLPKGITVEAFKRVTITALQENPELLAAQRHTLFSACLKCAKDGLLPDGKEAALVIFNKNIAAKGKPQEWVKTVAYMPMVDGLKKRIWRTGEYTYISAHPVYENDEFDYCLGDSEYVKHKPAMADRGKVIAAYAIIKNKYGEYMRCVLTLEDIEKIRAASKGAEGNYWTGWFEQMAVKSAIRRLAKDLDLSVDYEDDLPVLRDEPKPLLAKPEIENKPMLAKPQTESEPKAEAEPEQDAEPESDKPRQGLPLPQKAKNTNKNPF
jgi:recombination protein RecT